LAQARFSFYTGLMSSIIHNTKLDARGNDSVLAVNLSALDWNSSLRRTMTAGSALQHSAGPPVKRLLHSSLYKERSTRRPAA
jgi:hypothetical protein